VSILPDLPSSTLASSPARLRCDVFCHVVDNFGDAAVCWRLARSLAAHHGFAVRLWIDRPEVLAALQPAVDPALDRQVLDAVDIRRLPPSRPSTDLPDVAIDAFGNGLPAAYADALAARRPRALWIVLEYLSAEDWAAGVHGLASPHPSLDIRRFFFCPGFGVEGGGLLREPGLVEAREAFDADARARAQFWDGLGLAQPPEASTVVSLFGYPNPGLPGLLASMAAGPRPVLLALSPGALGDAAVGWLATAAGRADALAAGSLQARRLPFLPQPGYDDLLRASDLNFVRGEDSLVRALWAARPLCWQLYPQQDDAQCPKLEAFIGAAGRLCDDGMPAGGSDGPHPAAHAHAAWARLQRAWNGCGLAPAARSRAVADAWQPAFDALPVLGQRAGRLARQLASAPDLAARLAGFCRDQLK
jgi:uncharacterized repeat protein (TIGR03837 family)